MLKLADRLYQELTEGGRTSITRAEALALIAETTPAAEPTAGDAREVAEIAARFEKVQEMVIDGQRVRQALIKHADIRRLIEIAQRQARPSLGDDAVALARRMHEAYERLAPQHGYETREDTRVFDPESSNGKLMIAVSAELLDTRPSLGAAADASQEIKDEIAALDRDLQLAGDAISAAEEQEIAEIEKRWEAAHTGPWHLRHKPGNFAQLEIDDAADCHVAWATAGGTVACTVETGIAIAAAPTDMRYLLAEVRRLTAAIRASSPEGSHDGSPEGEGGRET